MCMFIYVHTEIDEKMEKIKPACVAIANYLEHVKLFFFK